MAAALVILSAGCQSPSASKPAASAPSAPATAAPAAAATSAAPAAAAPMASGSAMLPVPVHILAGSADGFTDDQGNKWIGYGNFFADGETIDRPGIPITGVSGTNEARIYYSERYSMTKFSYGPIPNGNYTVKLRFCETYDGITGPGGRVFSYTVGDHNVKDMDLWAKAGGFEKAYTDTVPVTVTDNKVTVTFTPNVENPQINGIEILPR